jgi:hypothetical protein
MKNTSVLLALVVLSSSAHAASVTCSRDVIFVVGTGGTETHANLKFDLAKDATGNAVLTKIKGAVEFPDYGNTTFAQSAANAAADRASGQDPAVALNYLVGSTFDIALATASVGYDQRSRVYRNSYQFKNLDCRGMQGYDEEIADFTMMIPKSAFGNARTDFQATAEVGIDQNAARLVLNCKFD